MRQCCSFLLVLIATIGCSKSTENGNNNTTGGGGNNNNNNTVCSPTKSFATDINPIIQSTCAVQDCHAAGSSNGPGALTTYQRIFDSRTNIRSAVSSGTMPKTGSLSTDQKNAIICWIDGGAPNN